jgi:hypothetical protein
LESNNKSYTLEFEHRQSYLHAVATGKRESIETCKEVWERILAEGKKNNFKKYLVEKEFDELGTISELKGLMRELSEHIDDEYIAYIDTNTENKKTLRLAEMSASNLGLEIKFFTSIGEAKEWLLLQ